MIADTSFVLDVLAGNANALALREEHPFILLPAVVVFEVWTGIHLSRNPEKERQTAQSALQRSDVLPFDGDAAMAAGKLNAELIRKGTSIGTHDAMIAAATMRGNDTLITRNVKHFSRVPGLRLQTY